MLLPKETGVEAKEKTAEALKLEITNQNSGALMQRIQGRRDGCEARERTAQGIRARRW